MPAPNDALQSSGSSQTAIETCTGNDVEKASVPPVSPFTSRWQEVGFVFAIMLGQSFNLTPFGTIVNARYNIAEHLGVANDPGEISWLVAAFSLTTGSFVLVGGRLGDVYGHRLVWLCALAWTVIWNLVSGFAASPAFFGAARGLTGIGSGMMLPAAIALLARAYPPGKKRNVFFGLFGALAPFSAAGGSIFEILLLQLVDRGVQWIWWLHAIKTSALLCVAPFAMPKSIGTGLGGKVDWIGAFIGVAGLILFNAGFNQAPLAGWQSASTIVPLVVGLAAIAAFVVYEAKVAKAPILPFSIWRAPTFLAVISTSFLAFMSFGIWVFYFIRFTFVFRGASNLQAAAYVTPITVNGFLAAGAAAFLVSRVPAQVIFCIGLLCVAIGNILTATARPQGTYWTNPFFGAAFAAFSPDLCFTAAQLISSNTVKQSEQGVAGSLVGTVLNYGLALGIALGATVESHTNRGGTDPLRGLRGALYLGIGMSVLGLVVVALFIRVPKDTREGYDLDEKPDTAQAAVA